MKDRLVIKSHLFVSFFALFVFLPPVSKRISYFECLLEVMTAKVFFRKRVVQHGVFWLAVLTLSTSRDVNQYQSAPFLTLFVNILAEFIFEIITSYTIAYYLIPRLYFKKKYLSFSLWLTVLVYFSSVLCRVVTVYVAEPIVRVPPLQQEGIYEILTELGYLIRHYTLPVFSSTLLFLFTKFFMDYQRERERSFLLKSEKSELELKTLKAQLNPHFLFNTLNNIYSLSVTESEKVPEAIGKLADILDTILYKCETDFVSIASEIELLENYVELEKLRYDDRLEVHLEKHITSNNLVPPLVLLSLAENAFKHGAGEDSGSPKIWIDIETDENGTRFRIRNTVFELQNSEERKNIGFPNVHKQLELLYGDDYAIETTVSDNLFEVNLTLTNRPENEN